MNLFNAGDILSLSGQEFQTLFVNEQIALLKNKTTDAHTSRDMPELLQLWSEGQLQIYDKNGQRTDPDGLSEHDQKIVNYRLPYALRFYKGIRKSDAKEVVIEVTLVHPDTQRRKIPGVSTCYRWASQYRTYGLVGLRNGYARSKKIRRYKSSR